jgi:O-6-methylguanine DNA methyltransferase
MLQKDSFQKRVLKIVSKIPSGETRSYKKIAELSGHPLAWRAVGNILNKNRSKAIPCHRVICLNGQLGGYNLGKKKKREILKKEGAIK